MIIKIIPITEVFANPNNPRTIDSKDLKKLKSSISDFRKMLSLRPIIVNSEMRVLGGNMRLLACQQLGFNEIPIIKADDLTPEEQERFIIADNFNAGAWNWDILKSDWDLNLLSSWGLDIPDDLIVNHDAVEDDFNAPVGGFETDIVLGDFFEIGEHCLLCGDSADVSQIDRLMDGEKADLVFTDPPYGVDYTGKTKDALKIKNDKMSESDLTEKVSAWFSGVDIATRPGAYLLATVPPGPLHLIFAFDWKNRGWLRQIMVWNKSRMVFGHSEYHYKHEPILFGWKEGGERLKCKDRTKTTVWDFEKPTRNSEHPTIKPVKMWEYGIVNHSKIGDILYEPFCGSGTTMVAAHQLKRKCYGMELDPKYCQVIINRMLKLDPELFIKRNGEIYANA